MTGPQRRALEATIRRLQAAHWQPGADDSQELVKDTKKLLAEIDKLESANARLVADASKQILALVGGRDALRAEIDRLTASLHVVTAERDQYRGSFTAAHPVERDDVYAEGLTSPAADELRAALKELRAALKESDALQAKLAAAEALITERTDERDAAIGEAAARRKAQEDAARAGCTPCTTADGCNKHQVFSCATCGKRTPWSEGGADAFPDQCADCFVLLDTAHTALRALMNVVSQRNNP